MDSVKDSLAQGYNTVRRALSTAPPNDAYLRWDAPGVEEVKPDEEAKAQHIADTMNKMQKHNFDKVSMPSSIVHLQSNASTHHSPASARLPGNPCEIPRSSERHSHRSLRTPSPPLPRPLRATRPICYRLPLRQRTRLLTIRHRTRPPRHGHQGLPCPRRKTRHLRQPRSFNPGLFLQQCPNDRTDGYRHLSRDYAAAGETF